jgi:hypothetical protein
MANSQGDPIGSPVPRIGTKLRSGLTQVANHSANPVEVQANKVCTSVKCLMRGGP